MQLQKHRDKLQKEKEAALLKRLTTDFALLPVTVLRLAAQEVDWEAGPASALLSVFQQAAQDQLAALTEVSFQSVLTVHLLSLLWHLTSSPAGPAAIWAQSCRACRPPCGD